MEVAIGHEHGTMPITVFHVKGEIDTDTFRELEAKAQEAFAQGTRNLLLDLTEVTYISSAGLRAIHFIFKLLAGDSPGESGEAMSQGLRDGTFKSPHLKLLKPSRTVQEILRTTGFDMFLEIHRDLREAVASF
jgi:anti-anti-sigma regulatory factor